VDTPDFILFDQQSLGVRTPAILDDLTRKSTIISKSKLERIQTQSSKNEEKKMNMPSAGEPEESPEDTSEFKHMSSAELQLKNPSPITVNENKQKSNFQ